MFSEKRSNHTSAQQPFSIRRESRDFPGSSVPTPNAGDTGLTPDQGTKIQQAALCSLKKDYSNYTSIKKCF